MKKIFLTLCVALFSVAMFADGLKDVRVYINPGHGSWGPNDRPMATIPYPNLASTGMPDHDGFYESNTNLWKCFELGDKLEAAGAFIMYSRTDCGPWPYEKVNGEYPDYAWPAYSELDDYETYNRPLSDIREEVDANNMDYFISVHSNAATDGNTVNYLYLALRGDDAAANMTAYVEECNKRAQAAWPHVYDAMGKGLEIHTNYTYTDRKIAQQSLGVLRHSVPGYLSEGYFHTYQPSRHRALNRDYCREEGLRYYRGIAAWYGLEGAAADGKGYILGTVKDLHEKMTHELYKYQAKTHDQFIPLNGAVVKLLKSGLEIASYTVDNNYNGLFFFRDLEPGNDYTLEVECAGYKPLSEDYELSVEVVGGPYRKGQFVKVEANETTHPFIFLENENYVPDDVVYEDYPDQALDGIKLAAAYDMEKKGEQSFLIEGTIKRTIGLGDSTIVLSHTADKVAHLYLVDHLTGNISTLSTKGIIAPDANNAGDYLGLSDIAYTSDGKLVGCNYIRCQYDASYVDAGYNRGTIRFYKWDKLSADPVLWVSSQHSGNWYRADGGYTMTVAGPSEDCEITTTFTTSGTSTAMRFSLFSIVDNQIASVMFTMKTTSAASPFTVTKLGEKHMLQSSPRNPKGSWVIDGNLTTPIEWKPAGQNADNTIEGIMAEEVYGKIPSVINFFKYAGRSLSVAPYEVEGKIAGVRVFDITDGLDKAVLIPTNTDLEIPVAAEFAAATVAVNGATWTIYLFADNKVITFAQAPVEIKPASHLNAYASQLKAEQKGNNIEFSYFLNAPVNAAEITLTGVDTEATLTIPLTGLTAGAHTQTADISALADGAYSWSLKVEGDVVTEVSKDFLAGDHVFDYYQPRGFASDRNPNSPYFGQLYISNSTEGHPAAGLADDITYKAIYVYSPDMQEQGYYTGNISWGTAPHRLFVDENGLVYASNWDDAAGGIYTMDPANPTANFKSLFDPAKRGTTYTKITGFDFIGTGAERILVTCDGVTYSGGSVGNIYKYEIGEVTENFAGAPTTIATAGKLSLGNQHNTIKGDGRGGYWIFQNRNAEGGLQCLAHVTADGTKDYNSNTDKLGIGGSPQGAMDLSDDKTLMAISADQKIIVYEISWSEDGKPMLKKKYETNTLANNITGVTFDYAGNIITGSLSSERIYAFATPTDGVFTTPARETLSITKLAPTAATALEISTAALTLAAEETATLAATPTPADAVGLVYTWTSSKPEVAIVENGVVTAVAPGEATITVSATNAAMETPLTQTCVVTVTETAVTSVILSQETATLYAGDQIKLAYEIAPTNATQSEIIWASDNETVATVSNGIVTAVAPGEAKITISIKNGVMAEPVIDECVITVAEYVAVSGVTLSLTDTLIAKGATVTLKETIAPEGAMEVLKLWSSDNTSVATVIDGVVTAVGAGEANISIRVKSEKSDAIYEATCKVKVMVAVNAAMINEKELTITEGETAPLTLQYAPKDATDLTITWTSDKPEVATVADSVVTAVAPGEATITVTLQNAVMAEPVTATCKVIVEKKLLPITNVTLSAENDILAVGETLTLNATVVAPEEAPEPTITWTSSNEAVATVADGVVTAVSEGEAIITVSVINADMTEALTATCTIIVETPIVAVSSIVLSQAEATLDVAETLTLTATYTPEDATEPTITWISSDEAIATVADGVVTAVAEGEAIITVSAINAAMAEAVTATCKVTVKIVDGLLTIETSGIYYSMETIHNPQGLSLEVFNVNGQLIATGNENINMSFATTGTYIVRCEAGILKFVK